MSMFLGDQYYQLPNIVVYKNFPLKYLHQKVIINFYCIWLKEIFFSSAKIRGNGWIVANIAAIWPIALEWASGSWGKWWRQSSPMSFVFLLAFHTVAELKWIQFSFFIFIITLISFFGFKPTVSRQEYVVP